MAQRICDLDGCDRRHSARGMCSTHYNRERYTAQQRWPKEVRACVVCQAEVVRRTDNHHAPTCSVACRTFMQHGETSGAHYDWATDAAARARKHGAPFIEVVRREVVFDRDRMTCQGCNITCSEPDPFALDSATVDHVVPLSEGGEHSMSNVRTLCLSCNSARQARPAA